MEVDGYDIMGSVARGPAATVYQACQQQSGRPVALKVLFDAKPGDHERFEKEMAALDVLRGHPNIVELYDRGLVDGTYAYMALEWAAGGDAEALLASGVFPCSDVALVADRLLAALGSAHSNGILHRDVKPSNVLFGRGEILLSDFGIARITDNSVTRTSTFAGTVPYSAPETLARSESSIRSDLYSLGATTLTLATGRVPFTDMNKAFAAAMNEERLDTSDVPEPLRDWVSWLTSPRPEDRPTTAEEAAKPLRDLGLVHEPTPTMRAALDASPPPSVPAGAAAPLLGQTVANDMTMAAPRTETVHLAPAETGGTDLSRAVQVVGTLVIMAIVATVGLLVAGRDGSTATAGSSPETSTTTTNNSVLSPTTNDATSPTTDRQQSREEETRGSDSEGSDETNGDVGGGNETTTVGVPNVVGVGRSEATSAIERAGLVIEIATEPHEDVAEGAVIRQSISPGTNVERRAVVAVVVSSGPAPVSVPDLVDLPETAAVARLTDVGLIVDVERRADRERAEGLVIEQSIPAGQEVPPDASVVLVVSSGPPEVDVPDVRNLPVGQARAILEQAGFSVTVERQQTRDVEHDEVLEQRPFPEESLVEGSELNLVVAQWPACRTRTVRFERKLFEFMPEHRRGDRDFDDNGPVVTFDFLLNVRSDSVVAEAKMTAAELPQNNSDGTMVEGTQRTELVTASDGWRITGVDVPVAATIRYTDEGHGLDHFGAQGPLANAVFIGDGRGDDAGVHTQVRYTIKTFSAKLEETNLCISS